MTFDDLAGYLHKALQRIAELEVRLARVEARASRSSQTIEAVTVSRDDPRAEPATESQRIARVRRPSAPAIAAVVEASSHLDTIQRATDQLRNGLPQISRGLFRDEEENDR